MNPGSREGWGPSQGPQPSNPPQGGDHGQAQPGKHIGGFGASQQPASQPTGQASGPVLPPPAGAFFPSNQPPTHNLPTIAGLTQQSPGQSAGRPPSSESGSGMPPHQPPMQGYPSIPQGLHQQQHPQGPPSALERERDSRDPREREFAERQHLEESQRIAAEHREREIREREMRERQQQPQPPQQPQQHQQQHEHAAHENHAGPIHLHQPVAVAPHTIHGPNGILGGGSAPQSGPNHLAAPLGGPSGPGPMFGTGPVQQNEGVQRMQAQGQPSQQQLLAPFMPGPPMPQQQQAQQAHIAIGQGQQPILNDALSYLDQVKVRFSEQPDVYNKFLDIMKDFKSGAIDTPGVIERVSGLFTGHPQLIQGFNTFLPPGYKIECGASGDPNAIRVTTPMGTTVSSMPGHRPLSRGPTVNGSGAAPSDRQYHEGAGRIASGGWQPQQQPQQAQQPPQAQPAPGASEAMFSPNSRPVNQPMYGGPSGPSGQGAQGVPLSPEAQMQRERSEQVVAAQMVHQQEQRGVSQLQNAASVAMTGNVPRQDMLSPAGGSTTPMPAQGVNGAGAMGQHAAAAGGEKRGPVEFNHAISYVNKIKNRFAQQPDIYKQFLEILQTYQRESKPIQDVYSQVTLLFSSAPDLLEDFKQFLPESAAQAKAAAAARQAAAEQEANVMTSNVRSEPYPAQSQAMQHTPRGERSHPPIGNFAPTPSAQRDNKRKRTTGREGTVASTAPAPSMPAETGPPAQRPQFGQQPPPPKKAHGQKQPTAPEAPIVEPTLVPAPPEPMPPSTSTAATSEELAFFDRVKKFLGNKNSMNEFLKVCNLYSQDLISKEMFAGRAQAFIGGNAELMGWLRRFLGYEEKDIIIENRARTVSGRVALANCRGLNPSYRLLPKRERQRVCSGRDELCKAVLNDDWASHPTWASEDSGFVAHRKNIHEEILHRIEEERHDYDFSIEACARTIQLLEPIAQSLLLATSEEQGQLQLPPGLGGQSETIHKRVIYKLYGRDKGNDVCRNLLDIPSKVVPVLLTRLKSKLEEWKAAQREWEKVWRDQTQKVFWKSLDHQTANQKGNDKRQYQTKTLQNEIQVKFEEQRRQREIQNKDTPRYQYEFGFDDVDVLFDASQLVLSFAESVYATDHPRLYSFIKEFVPLFFGLDPVKFDQRLSKSNSGSPQPEDDEDTAMAEDGSSPRSGNKTNGRKNNLLRGVLDRSRSGKQGKKEESVASGSRGSTPDIASAIDEDITAGAESPAGSTAQNDSQGRWLEHPNGGNLFNKHDIAPNEPFRRDDYHMYANLPIYCFLRMFVMLYERLYNLKRNEANVHEAVRRALDHKPAHDLKMMDKTPYDFFSDVSPSANYYQQVLVMFQEQIRGEIDLVHIEETLRRFYLQTGWQLHSFDKLLGALSRFALAMIGSEARDKSWEIYQLFKKDRAREQTTHQDELQFRKQAEKYAKDGDIYRITFNQREMKAWVQIFRKDDATFDMDKLEPEKRWSYYISSWTSLDPTEGVPADRVRLPYEKSTLNLPALEQLPMVAEDDESPEAAAAQALLTDSVRSEEHLVIRVSLNNYKMLFAPATEEYMVRGVTARAGPFDPNAGVSEADVETVRRERIGHEHLVKKPRWMEIVGEEETAKANEEFAAKLTGEWRTGGLRKETMGESAKVGEKRKEDEIEQANGEDEEMGGM
ncbi:hypothetical protein BDY21DRAFT_336623 [Lineolata rhizophorae]|uniref:Histone deacetylase interacting domain-containing protein n=1 Tax=Lineolata rhizophorae TaxID=578093 RepID=A0A6A6P779_9PEZI|nr:hypothetical protein BDY21DRAFT_336623 [Lineolata rhizophorae]